MPEKRPTYHHGDLRAALIQAADEIISESGIEEFSLRAAAKRAGVSPAAPAHHFGSARGLLTEVAILAFDRLNEHLEAAGQADDAAEDMRAVALAFVRFAMEYPGHYRLMLRKDLVDRTDPRYKVSADRQATRVTRATAAYRGKEMLTVERFEDAADLLASLSMLHGLAHLVLDEKAPHFFRNANSREFVQQTLPRVLESIYP
ncbi:TetR/AcrR family transcriptional regulator [Terriglobus sp.]|uniref:TetR/AcrR family transcriptional regulator n=1 Tax=Terriglobus sp. TaxID=1889013 RepID=UPI003AFFE4FA